MLTRSTAFTLSKLKSAIVHHPLSVAPETSVMEAIAQMNGVRALCRTAKTTDVQLHELYLEARSSCVLVVQDGELLGLLTERDVVRLSAQQQPLRTLTIREVMVSPVVTLHEVDFTDLFFAINLLQQYRIRHLPILDEQDRPVGLVTHESLQQTTRPVDLLRLRLVSEVMTSTVICAAPESTMLAIAQQMAAHHVSAIMIVQPGGNQTAPLQMPVGIVTERDVVQFQALGLDLEACLAGTVMSTPIFAVPPDTSLWTVQQIMAQRLIRRLTVTGGQGELLGIVTQTSVLQALNPLELYKLAEMLAEKVGRLEAEKVALLENRTVELDQQVEARTLALKAKAKQEQLVIAIATQIRSSLSLQTILDTMVEQVRQLLGCERVNIWQFDADWHTIVVAESTHSSLSLLGERINDTCFKHEQTELYRQGQIRVVPDIDTTAMSSCHRNLLIRLQTRAKIMVPLLCGEALWGFLNVTESQHAREWQPNEVELLQGLAVQLAIALQQATNHQQLEDELRVRQQTEARLRDSEQRYASLAAAVPVGIFRTDTAGYGIYHNDRWYQIAGLSPDAAAGLGWLQGVHPDDRDRVVAAWEQATQETCPFQLEYRFQRADGTVTWVYGQAVAERDAQGQIIGYAGTITDISEQQAALHERNQAEAALIKSEAQSRAILAAIPDVMVRISADGRYRECVTANREIDLLPPGFNAVGLTMAEVLPPELAARQQHYLEQALQTGAVQVYEQQIQHGDRLQEAEVRVVKSGDDEALLMIRDISDRKRSEAALQRSEAHQRALISAIPDLITRINRAGIYLEFVASPNFHVMGHLPEIVGTHVFDSLPPDLAQKRLEFIQQVLQTKSIQVYEQDLSVAGRTQIEEVRVVPYSEDEVLVLVRDISDRKLAEAERQHASNQIARQLLIIESAIDGIAILHGGTFRYLNKSHIAMFGYTLRGDLLGQSWQILYSTEEVHRFQQEVFPVLEANGYWQGEAIATRNDGTTFYEEVSLTSSSNGDLICVCRDISERKRAEIELRLHKDQLAQLAAIVESSHDAIISITPDGMITSWNHSAERLFGYTAQEAIGNPVVMLMPLGHQVEDIGGLQFIHPGQPVNTYETQRQRKDGSLVEVALTVSPIWGENGTVIGASKIARDISDRKRAEAALQNLIAGTAATTGQDFFPALVSHIAQALHVSYAMVSERVDETLHVLAFWANGALQPTFSYHPAQTPCEHTLQDGQFYCDSFVQTAFPYDLDLVEMAAYSYLGIALKDSQGVAIGSLCILDQRTIQDSQRAEQILQVFAARAAAELGRQRAKTQLQQLNQDLEVRVEQRTIELQAREAQLRDLFDNATDLIQSVAPDGQILFVNTAWKETLGYNDADLEQLSIFQIIHDDERGHYRVAIQSLFAGALCLGIETRFVTKDGREITVEGNVNCQLKEGQPIATRGIFRDITQRKKAETALYESQQFLQTVLNTFPLAVFWKDRASVYLGCNQNFAIAAALASPTDVVGKTDYDLPWNTSEADLYRADDRETIDAGTAKLGIIETLCQADGTTIWIETNKLPLRNLKGDVIGILGTFHDISEQQAALRERKRAEAELQKLSERLALSLKSGAIGCWEWNIPENTIFWDERMYELYGVTKQLETRMAYELWANGLHPDDRIAAEALAQQGIAGETEYDTEFRVVHPDGSIHFIKAYGVLVRNAQNQPQSMIGVNFDISDRKQAEQTIRQQAEREALLREITQRIRQSLDLQTIFDTACQEIRQVIQADRVGIFKFDPDSHFDHGEFVAEAVVGGFPSVVMMQVHDHCFGEKHAPLYIQGRYAAMNDIYQLDECHTNVLTLFQVRANLVMPLICGETLWGLLCVHQCATPRHWREPEIDLTQQLANQLAIAIQQSNLFEQLQQELAERQQAEAKLTESNQQLALSNQELARATRLKDEFLANMSHELRTPLNAILGMTEGLQEQVFGIVNEPQRKALQTIERSGTHLLELINDILDVAKIEAGQIELDFTAVSVAHLCRSSLAFINQQALRKQIQLEIKLELNLPDLLVDERRMRQVLINLLNNAVKFTPEGGRITLEARGQEAGVKGIDTTNDAGINHLSRSQPQGRVAAGAWIRLSVIDTGIGIAPAHISQLFQPFVQIDSALNRQYTGTGLGLALVKQLVELHGGRVDLISELGAGSCFTIKLPCIPSLTHPSTLSVSNQPIVTLELDALAHKTAQTASLILLVEDNEANINTVSSYLRAKGYRLLLAKNGLDAIDLATTHQPDLILMDIQMPGMDGLEIVRQIRRQPHLLAMPIIALTALAMTGDRERCLEAGANDYLTKPVKLKQLAATIQQFLEANNHL